MNYRIVFWTVLGRIRIARLGFTLIELLVVLAILVILSALTMSGVAAALEKGRRTTCLSNTRQIAFAAQMLFENKLYLPERSNPEFYGEAVLQLLPFLKNNLRVFDCPSNRNPLRNAYTQIPGTNVITEYEFNGYLCSLSGLPRPTAGINDWSRAAYSYDYPHWDLRYAHEKGINVAYLDGHASWLPREEMGLDSPNPADRFYRKGHTFE